MPQQSTTDATDATDWATGGSIVTTAQAGTQMTQRKEPFPTTSRTNNQGGKEAAEASEAGVEAVGPEVADEVAEATQGATQQKERSTTTALPLSKPPNLHPPQSRTHPPILQPAYPHP